MAKKNKVIEVQGSVITVLTGKEQDYISLTDMIRNIKNGPALIEKWLRNKNTIEFQGIWGEIYNPDFNYPEFEGIRNQVELNSFVLSEKLITKQAAAQFVQIPLGQNVTKNLPDEFRSSLPSIKEIEAKLSGAEESQ